MLTVEMISLILGHIIFINLMLDLFIISALESVNGNLGSLVLGALLLNGTYPDSQSHALDETDKRWGRKIISSLFHRDRAE